MPSDNNMGKLSISLTKEAEKKLRKIAEHNTRSISHQIAHWVKHDKTLEEES